MVHSFLSDLTSTKQFKAIDFKDHNLYLNAPGKYDKKNLTKGFHSQRPRKKLYAQRSSKGQEISEVNFGVFNSPNN